MPRDKRRDAIETVGIVAIIASLLFLAFEIRQTNRIAIATTEITVREAFGSSNETVYTNPETAALLAKARSADAEFSDAEREMLDYFVARLTNIWEGIEEAYANEMVSRVTFDKAIEDMKWHIDTYPGMRSFFEDWVEVYPSSAETELIREMIRYLEEK